MEDTRIEVNRDAPTTHGNEENELYPSITSRKTMMTSKGVMFASVTLMVGAVVVFSVAAIGLLSFLFTVPQAESQSKSGQGMTSGAGDQSEALHIEKRQGTCQENVCLTKECVQAASYLLTHMDDSVHPCDDFYRYACGGWMKSSEHRVADEALFYSVVFNVLSDSIDIVLKELLRTRGNVPQELLNTKPYEDLFLFYERCKEVDQDSLDMASVHEVLLGLDQFQVGRTFDPTSWDLTRALLQLFRINGAPLFDVIVDSDVNAAGKYAIFVTSSRNFGLISQLKGRPPQRRNRSGLQEFLKARGRHMLFGERAENAGLSEAIVGIRAEGRTGKRANLHSHTPPKAAASGRVDSAENLLIVLDDLKKEEGETTKTPPEEASTSSSPFSSPSATSSSSITVPPSSPHIPSPSSNHVFSFPTTPTTTSLPTTVLPSTTTTTITTTSAHTPITHPPASSEPLTIITVPRSPNTTDPPTTTTTTTNTAAATTTTTTSTTTTATATAITFTPTNTSKEQIGEGNTENKYSTTTQSAVSRRTVYRIFKGDMDVKRLESLATSLQVTFPNASVFVTPSSPLDADVPDDVYSEVITRFLPILQKLQPSEREQLELQQAGMMYNAVTISALQQRCPVIDWFLLLSELFNTTITDNHTIYVHYPDHLTKMCTLLDNTEPWVLHYAILTLYSFDVLQETVYAGEGMSRGDFCLQAVKKVFGEVMSTLYLHHIGNDTLRHIRNSASSTMNLLRDEVEGFLTSATWLGEDDKEKALHKLRTMELEVGGFDKHFNISFAAKSHENVSFPPNATFLHTVLELYRAFREQLYQLYHTPVQKDEFIWSFSVQPYTVNAFYVKETNTIVIPEAFFHPPYHRHTTPHYLNFGSTAMSMAHEIFHGFDISGVQFDQSGLMTRPFSKEMAAHLEATADCYHALLQKTFYEEVYIANTLIALEIDNTITKNENLADISGLRTAFQAYRRWEEREGVEPRLPALPLTPHQMFFLSSAQPYCSVVSEIGSIFLMELDEHLPHWMRINAMMKNFPEFSETFNCSATSRMFSSNHCSLF